MSSYVVLDDGARIHMTTVEHCVRDIDGVQAYQMVQERDRLTLNLRMEGDLPGQVEKLITGRLRRVHPLLAEVRIAAVEELKQTATGKTPAVVDAANPAGEVKVRR